MSLKASKRWGMVFAVTNLGLFVYNDQTFNLSIGIIMCVWVMFLEFNGVE